MEMTQTVLKEIMVYQWKKKIQNTTIKKGITTWQHKEEVDLF